MFHRESLLSKLNSGEWREEIRRRSREGVEKTFKQFTDYSGNIIVETQEISWIENATNEERSRLHRYLTEDGRVGGSGLPDPKRIHLENGERYHLARLSIQEPCSKCGRTDHEWPRVRPHTP